MYHMRIVAIRVSVSNAGGVNKIRGANRQNYRPLSLFRFLIRIRFQHDNGIARIFSKESQTALLLFYRFITPGLLDHAG